MKNLIIYSTRKGSSYLQAKKLTELLIGDTVTVNIKEKPSVSGYDTVILGGAVLAGRIKDGMQQYATKMLGELLNKKIGLFVCCLDKNETHINKYFENSFPSALIDHAIVKKNLGGSYFPEKENLLMRFIMKRIGAKPGKFFLSENLEEFAAVFNQY